MTNHQPVILHSIVTGDFSAIGQYRMLFPMMCSRAAYHDVKFIESERCLTDPLLYKSIRSIKFQRLCSDAAIQFMQDVVKPYSDAYGFWIIMDIDDCLCHDDIPDYNIAKKTYAGKMQDNIRKAINLSDIVTTTTPILADYYTNKWNIPREKFVVIPNYLPRWWIGDSYRIGESVHDFREANKRKLKIGFICGGNHYDLENANGGVDDFTHLIDWVKSSVDVYDFHFVGGIPQQLMQEYKEGKIRRDPGCDILNYPREIKERKYNIWISPLQDNVFNRCKSNIKLIEAWSLGIPIFVQDCTCYSPYTPNRFKTANDLENMISSIRTDEKKLIDMIKIGKQTVDFGDQNSPNGWWLEKNMSMHRKMFTIPQKTMKIDFTKMEKDGKNA